MPEIDLPTEGPSARLLASLNSGPVLIDQGRFSEFMACLKGMFTHEKTRELLGSEEAIHSDDGFWPEPGDWMNYYRPYTVIDGVLQIPVMGALINHMSLSIGRYATGYVYIQRAFERGMEDPGVRSIAFLTDSPGGQAAGNFELVDKIYARRGEKKMVAFVADTALSGGFSIASAADEIVVTRSGATGSVGVAVMHMDLSGYLQNVGIKVTFVHAGEHKVDGNRYEPLSEETLARMQARVDKTYDVFVSTIARNREMGQDAIRATEALVYDAEESIEIGFADRIGDIDEEMSALIAEADDDKEEERDVPMADAEDNLDEQLAAARTEGASAERNRFVAVMASEHYAGREAVAAKLLAQPSLDAEAIVGVLADTPKIEAPSPKQETEASTQDHFAEAMDKETQPNVGGNDADGSGEGEMSVSEGIWASAGVKKMPRQ